jgi:hypothetical protein
MTFRARTAWYSSFVAAQLIGASLATSPVGAAESFDWLPSESQGAELSADLQGGEQIIPAVVLTDTPKQTADLSKFTKVYTLDLAKFGVRNDGTDAEGTSKGLNAALQDAKTTGANRIVFPAGIYLIHEKIPLEIDHKNTVIDLNGATLRINPNGLPKYSVIEIVAGAENVRLTNGTLVGDKASHDFKTTPGTHEWGAGISFVSGDQIEVDRITAVDMTGDGVASHVNGTRSRDELLKRIWHSIYVKHLESGGLSDGGNKIADPTKTRSIKPFDMSTSEGMFELGYMGGYMGYPFIKGRVFQAYFYDDAMKFLERKKCLQYRKVALPAGARWMHLELNQPEVSDEPAHVGAVKGEWVARITNFKPSTNVHFHDNVLARNRRLGMAYCGGQKWLIENNRFEENGGTAPAYGVDFEDGSELMQDVVFRNNTFRGNRGGDLVVCAGSELVFEGNQFEKNVVTWGRLHNYAFRNNRFGGGGVTFTTRTGVAEIRGNRYENCKLSIVFDTKAVADGLVRKSGKTVATPPLRLEEETLVNVSKVSGTYFDFTKCVIRNSSFVVGKETRLVRLQDCKIDAGTIHYEAEGPPVAVAIRGGDGTLVESGPGLSRKK